MSFSGTMAGFLLDVRRLLWQRHQRLRAAMMLHLHSRFREDPEDIERLVRELGIRLPDVPDGDDEREFVVDADWDEDPPALDVQLDPED